MHFAAIPTAPTPRPGRCRSTCAKRSRRLYAAYLAKTAERPLFSDYPAAERMADFQAIFGSDLKMFEAKFLRYMQEVK